MSYPKKLLRLRPTKGIASDTPAHELGPDHYSIGSNVLFRRGFAQRILGSRAVYGTLPVDPVLHILNARVDTTNFWLFFGEDEVHALETSNSDEVTPAGGLTAVAQPWEYSSTLLSGVPVFTNGKEKPQYWAGNVATPFADLTDWPATTICKSIVAFRNFLVALDIDGPGGHFESQIKWSDAADPGTIPSSWTPAADNLAGDAILADTPGPALMGLPLRGSLLLYKRSSTYAMDFIGGNDVFSLQTLFTSSGALTRHAACDVNGQHFVVTDGDIILTDGTSRKSVGQARMREFLFNQLDQDNYENLFTIYHRAKGEVWTCFPESGSQYCTLALVYDVANDSFGIRELADVACAAVGIVNDEDPDESWAAATYTWTSASQLWNKQNFSLATESLVLGYDDTAEMQDTDDAVAVDASVGRYDLTFGEPERVKFVRRVHVRAVPSGFGSLLVRVGSRMSPSDSIDWGSEVTLTAPDQIVNAFAQGRYISVELRSTGTEVWTVTGVDLEAELRGYH